MIPFEADVNGNSIQVQLNDENNLAIINGNEVSFSVEEIAHHRLLIRVGTKIYRCDNISVSAEVVSFSINGTHYDVKVKDEEQLLLEKLGFNSAKTDQKGIIFAPMPGKILEIPVSVGDEVEIGEAILILEAMKMENELKASLTGIIHSVQVKTGDSVEKNQILLEIKARG